MKDISSYGKKLFFLILAFGFLVVVSMQALAIKDGRVTLERVLWEWTVTAFILLAVIILVKIAKR